MKKEYNKLVRDNIPEMIINTGSACKYRQASETERLDYLKAKVQEELDEFKEAYKEDSLSGMQEELVDLITVTLSYIKEKQNNIPYCDEDNEDYEPEGALGETNLTLSGDEWIEDTSVIEDAIDEIADEEDISANDILITISYESEESIELLIIVHLTDETAEQNYPDFAGEGEDYDDEESFMETEE